MGSDLKRTKLSKFIKCFVNCSTLKNQTKMYPETIVKPMKSELTTVGFEDLTTPEAVDLAVNSKGTVLVVVNSVCGCAAGAARPALKLAIQNGKKPDRLTTVFAGFDTEATAQARKHFAPYPPSSPSVALFKDGKLVHFIERHHIEGRSAQMIADNLKAAFDEYC
jgi:putative YphP/YqiW family bacilliredoxin